MATGRPYSRILDSFKLFPAAQNWLDYQQNADRRGQNVGQGDPRPPSRPLFVAPFNVPLATGQTARQSAADPAWTSYGTHFSGYTSATEPADKANIVRLKDYAAARVVITSGRSNTGTVKTSNVTKMKYLDYGGQTTSVPFGKQVTDDTQQDVFEGIAASIRAANTTSSLALSLKPEIF